MLTGVSNRIGDVILIMRLSVIVGYGRLDLYVEGSGGPLSKDLIFLLLISASTKRAQIPFCAWLPAAMAAPTPVSRLVHSSTLVTAGAYLLFRSFRRSSSDLIFFLGLLTIGLARVRAISEIDIKKIVALSTLSQVGLIFTSLGLNLIDSSFFHLLVHAYLKAILFISVGRIIHLSRDYQDLRNICLRGSYLPLVRVALLIGNFRLTGLPFCGAFYSKDMIFERALILKIGTLSLLLFFFILILTLSYSLRIIGMIILQSRGGMVEHRGHDSD